MFWFLAPSSLPSPFLAAAEGLWGSSTNPRGTPEPSGPPPEKRHAPRQRVRTFDVVGTVVELQLKDVVRGAVGVHRARHLPAADEAVLTSEDDDGPVDQLHEEVLRLSYAAGEGKKERHP